MKKTICFFVMLFVFLLSSNTALAENFIIDDYDVQMKVYEDKSVNVTERIDVTFTEPSHGIYREIPLSGGKIDNIKVNHLYTKDISNDNLSLKIGDENLYVQGYNTYVIKYTHHLYDKPNEFYYNIIGTGWCVPIKHASFNVEMPKPFNKDSAGISIGYYGMVGFQNRAKYTYYGNTIQGETTSPLNANEGITLRIPVPNSYFKNNTKYIVLLVMTLLTALSFIIWYILGKDDNVTPVVTFYPPKGFNSAEAEVLYSGKSTTKGLVSLIVYLANKGYLSISQSSSLNFYIKKLKDYDGKNPEEKRFIDMLVPNKSITSGELATSTVFYKDCEKYLNTLDRINDTIFYSSSLKARIPMSLILCGLILTELYIGCNFSFDYALRFLLFLIPLLPATFILFEKKISFLVILFFLIPFIIEMPNSNNLALMIFGAICIIIAGICYYQIPKRNQFGNSLLGELRGFKKFLETVELPRVKTLVEENPNYCFDVLPYLYIFDLTDKWIGNFEQFFTRNPDWYHGSDFYHHYNCFTQGLEHYTQPSTTNGGMNNTSSSSSSGGGGFSGGGCGGGGGGSW